MARENFDNRAPVQSTRWLHAAQGGSSDGNKLNGDAVWLLRQHAAASRFNASVFCDECIMNILGWLCLPYMLWRHTTIGAVNRGFLTNIAQICFTLMFWYINGLAAWYWRHPSSEFSVSYWNVVVVDMLFVLRATIIATKYASYLPSEYRAVDTRLQSPQELGAKNLLVGWLSTGTTLLAEEVERAIVRACPDLTHFRMVFSDAESRITALSAMQDCLPSYFLVHGYLLGKDDIVPVNGATAAKVPASEKLGRHSLFAFILSKVHFLPSCRRVKVVVQPASAQPGTLYSQIDSPDVTDKQQNGMWATICAHPLMACMQPDNVITPSVTRRAVNSSAPPMSPSQAAGMCCLPAKLFLWHILYTVYVKHNPGLAKFSGNMSVVAGLGYGCLPAITHIVLQGLDTSTWQNVSMLVFSSISCVFWMMLQHAYSNIGVVDQTRHLHTSKELLKLLDINNMSAQSIPTHILQGSQLRAGVPVEAHAEARVSHVNQETHANDTTAVSRRASLLAFKRDVQLIDQRLKDFTPEEVAVIVQQRRESPAINVLHPNNIFVWDCIRSVLLSFGESFNQRVNIYTGFNVIAVISGVGTIYYLILADVSSALTGLIFFAYGLLVTVANVAAQIFQGSRFNQTMLEHEQALTQVLFLASELSNATISSAYPDSVRDMAHRLKQSTEAALHHVRADALAKPARVLWMRCDAKLLTTIVSISGSAIVVAVPKIASAVTAQGFHT